MGGAVLGEVNFLIILAGMMVGPFLFNWRFVQLTLRELDVTRRLTHRVCAGETLTVNVTADNRRTRLTSWAVMIEDQILRDGDPERGQPAESSTADTVRSRRAERHRSVPYDAEATGPLHSGTVACLDAFSAGTGTRYHRPATSPARWWFTRNWAD